MTVNDDRLLVDRHLPSPQLSLVPVPKESGETISLEERVQQILASHRVLTAEQRARLLALLR